MSFKRPSLLVSSLLIAVAACTTPPSQPPSQPSPPPPAQPATPVPPVAPAVPQPAELLQPRSFAPLPGWQRDDLRQAWPAFMTSCQVLASQPDWREPCSVGRDVDAADARAVRTFFEAFFQPYQLFNQDGTDSGLVTGYYEPLLRGARKRGGPFQTPLYRVPDDLLTVELGSLYPQLEGMRLRGRLVGNKVVPYFPRAELEKSGALTGKELLWVDDPVEAFFLQVQGSGRVRLADGAETVRVAYADQNGHPYQSIGRYLVERGELKLEQASAQGIKAWAAANPARRQELLDVNPSYVFFREEKIVDPARGPKGALGVPLTPQRSIAVDTRFVPPGAPVFLATTQPNSERPLQRLMLAQDTGGAIKGAVRADFFWGFGAAAGEQAGRMKQRGQMWVLWPKGAVPPRPRPN
ncbi:MAG: murein transglycosylase A [Burkholderiaceae bacterium]